MIHSVYFLLNTSQSVFSKNLKFRQTKNTSHNIKTTLCIKRCSPLPRRLLLIWNLLQPILNALDAAVKASTHKHIIYVC